MTTSTTVLPFSARLKSLRRQHRLSQAGLAAASGLREQHVWHLENKTTEPSMETMRRLAFAFGLSLSELLEGVG